MITRQLKSDAQSMGLIHIHVLNFLGKLHVNISKNNKMGTIYIYIYIYRNLVKLLVNMKSYCICWFDENVSIEDIHDWWKLQNCLIIFILLIIIVNLQYTWQ